MRASVCRCLTPLLLAALAMGCDSSGGAGKTTSPKVEKKAAVPSTKVIRANDRAVGLMGKFEYEAAHKVLAKLHAESPENLEIAVNLAIAKLNRQLAGDEDASLELLAEVLKQDPHHLRAHYCSGLLLLHHGSTEQAIQHFRAVAKADPRDAYAAYHVGQCLVQLDKANESLEWYLRSTELDPYLRSAYYGAFQVLSRQRKQTEAARMMEEYRQLEQNPQARLVELKYTRMGPKSEVAALEVPSPKPARLKGAVFAGVTPLAIDLPDTLQWNRSSPAADISPSVTVGDLNGDAEPDLLIAAGLVGEEGIGCAPLIQRQGKFELQADHPLRSVTNVQAVLWGDFDNDGLTDAYFCRREANQLWRQSAAGEWQDVTEATHTAGQTVDTIDGAMIDADHDGDLDLVLVPRQGPLEILSNNLDGTFRSLVESLSGIGDARPAWGLLPVDLDHDRDVDLVVIKQSPPHEVYVNDRLWKYKAATGYDEFVAASFSAALAADLNSDGQTEIYTAGEKLTRWQPDKQGVWRGTAIETKVAMAPRGSGRPVQLAIADCDGDGVLDLLHGHAGGWAAIGLAPTKSAIAPLHEASEPGLAAWSLAVLGNRMGPALVGIRADGTPAIWGNGPGRYPFATTRFSGKDNKNDQMRSNRSGIGVQLHVRAGSRWTSLSNYRNQSGPGQSVQPLTIGLGAAKQADFVKIDWSDGVYQTELDLREEGIVEIVETQRQLSSCPVLFAWDGHQFQFITDLLGVGGIGFATGRGEYATPVPRENVLLPANVLAAREDRYRLKLGEPMEEACYLDAARLVAYDLPPGWSMILDERFAAHAPFPSGEVRCYRTELLPCRAENDRGENVLERVQHADLRAADPGARDPRFIGLTQEHGLTFSFDRDLDAVQGSPWLVADGWIEYPYSQTMFSAWQAGVSYQAPTVEAQDQDGTWRPVLIEFGYPAGMPRRMSVPLAGLPPGSRALRLRTNLEIYWDRLSVVYVEDCQQITRRPLALVSAELGYAGFPARGTNAQRVPDYQYARRKPLWDTRKLTGYHTAFGQVLELLSDVDDAVAVFGPGEEIELAFAWLPTGDTVSKERACIPLPGLPAAWTRRFVLETNGWCKDRDLFTRDGETIEPLPRRDPTDSSHDEAVRRLHEKYQTRFESGD